MRRKSRVEKQVWKGVAIVMIVVAGLIFAKSQSVHVVSTTTSKTPNGIVAYQIEVKNPSNREVLATLELTTGNPSSHNGKPVGALMKKFKVILPPGSLTTVEQILGSAESALVGPKYSVQVVDVAGQ